MKLFLTLATTLLWTISTALVAEDPAPLAPAEKALIEKAFDGQLATVQALVSKGVSVAAADENKRTALMWAAFGGHTSVVEFLHDKGADINAKDGDDLTALIYAAKGSALQTMEFLLKNSAEVDVQSKKQGYTALMTAAALGNAEMVRLLLENGACPDLKDADGSTARDYAQRNGHVEVADLMKNPAVPDTQP